MDDASDFTEEELMAAMLEVADDPEALERLVALADSKGEDTPDDAAGTTSDENV